MARKPQTRECLIEGLQALAERLGHTPLQREVDADDDSWTAALAEIGLQPRGSRLYARDELLSVLRDLAEELGHPPSQAELWEREGLPRPTTYKYRFGSWNRALEAAGLTPLHRKRR